ncbi:bpX6 domain-containing protein [Kitasatospora sp. NPDC054939]
MSTTGALPPAPDRTAPDRTAPDRTAPAPGAFRGTVDAAGFVLDTPVTGPAEAAARVLDHWRDGADLRRLPDGRWLLTLAAPTAVRADRAPGLPLRRTAGALVALGTDATDAPAGHLLLTTGGHTAAHPIAGLPLIDPAGWLDPGGLAVHRLGAVGTPPAPDRVLDDLAVRGAPDLRAAAGLGARSRTAGRLLGETGRPRLLDRLPALPLPRLGRHRTQARASGDTPIRPARRRRSARRGPLLPRSASATGRTMRPRGTSRRRPLARLGGLLLAALHLLRVALVLVATLLGFVVVWAGLAVIAVRAVYGGPQASGSRLLLASAIALVLAAWVLRTRGRAAGAPGGGTGDHTGSAPGRRPGAAPGAAGRTGRPRPPLLRGLFARLTLRTPAAHLVRGRHARYLHRLERAFAEQRWEDALRDAIQLAGPGRADGAAWLSLGLPARRAGALRPSPGTTAAGGSSLLSGPSVHQHLTELYRRAAEALEREGRIDEAAFVLADLLHLPAEAVALLDRHGRTAQAADLAEGRELDPELVVRLRWRAGHREHAVRIAHLRGVFAVAVERLGPVDPAAARELRLAWAEHCRSSGDRLGAVEALWPEESLRPSAAGDLREALALGGPTGGRALAHLLALGEGADTAEWARRMIDGAEPATTGGRAALLTALADLRAADPAVDRELATAAARAAVRDGGFGTQDGSGTERARFERLLKRADPLAAADLPSPVRPGRNPGAPLEITAADRPGTLPVLDAAVLGSGALLVACGHAGVRLLTPDGRTKARWDVPTDRLVLADHGGSALLVAEYDEATEIARLDLATRTVRPWATLQTTGPLSGYDGRHLIAVDGRGIVVLDTAAPRPTVVWRELGGGHAQAEERCLTVPARTAAQCSVVVATRPRWGAGTTECRTWELPGWRLVSRPALTDEELEPGGASIGHTALAGGGRILTTAEPDPGRTTLRWYGTGGPGSLTVAGAAVAPPVTDGDDWVLTVADPDGDGTGTLVAHAGRGYQAPALTARFPAAAPGPGGRPAPVGVRRLGGAVTYWHRSGRVLAVAEDGSVLANLRVAAD